MVTPTDWVARPETGADIPVIRAINLAAFDTALEADLIEALRDDPSWIDGLSIVSGHSDERPVGYALMTRCHVEETPALCLGPCAVDPKYQRSGAGAAAIRAGLKAAKLMNESYVIVLGHPTYYPRFGFTPAARYGIRLSVDVPGDALMALSLNDDPLPSGTVRYARPFGI